MVGCLYIPTLETIHKSGTADDFRPLFDPKQPGHLVLGKTNRSTVLNLLGQPYFESSDHCAVAYVMESHQGIGIDFLCFGLGPTTHRAYVLKLVYDKVGTLTKLDFRRVTEDQPVPAAVSIAYIMPNRPAHFSTLLYKIIKRINDFSDPAEHLTQALTDLRKWTFPNTGFEELMIGPSARPGAILPAR